MVDRICGECGARNLATATFCAACNSFLPWTSPEHAAPDLPVEPAPPVVEEAVEEPAGVEEAAVLAGVEVTPMSFSLVRGGPAVRLDIAVSNLSQIVDAYLIELVEPPSWLEPGTARIPLMPQTSDATVLPVRIAPDVVAPAGTYDLLLRIRSFVHPEVHLDQCLQVTVAPLAVPVGLRLEPAILRLRDTTSGQWTVLVDNTGGNSTRQVTLTATDPEGVVDFAFTPDTLTVLAEQTGRSTVRVESPGPSAGDELIRSITVTADDGRETVNMVGTLIVSRSARVPLRARLEPTITRLKDTSVGRLQVHLDNRGGPQRQVVLTGREAEGMVTFAFEPRVIDLPPGRVTRASIEIRSVAPEPGEEATRQLIVTAVEGDDELEITGTLIHTSSAPTADPPVGIRLDPSVLRIKDAVTGRLEVHLDNRSGTRFRRVLLSGRDPERAVRFSFTPPSLDIAPGAVAVASIRVESSPPEAGEEFTRNLVVAALDGDQEVEATGTLIHSRSVAVTDPPVRARLDPSVLRIKDTTSGELEIQLDNRTGTGPHHLQLSGRDPERAVRFSFAPAELTVAAGAVITARITVRSTPPEPGQEVTRHLVVTAVDGGHEVETTGTLLHTTSVDPPVAIRIEPALLRVRDSTTGRVDVVLDNRRAARDRRVSLSGRDLEGAVRFTFSPATVVVPRGEVVKAAVTLVAPAPAPGAEITRAVTIIAVDGHTEVEASANFVLVSSPPVAGPPTPAPAFPPPPEPRKKLSWGGRVALSLIGGLVMIAGATQPWTSEHSGFKITADQITGDAPHWLDGVSAGLLVCALAVLAMLGAISRNGLVTRCAAVLALGGSGLSVALSREDPRFGILLVATGCVIAFIGGFRPKRQ